MGPAQQGNFMTSAFNNIAKYKIIAAVIANILAFFAMLYVYIQSSYLIKYLTLSCILIFIAFHVARFINKHLSG